MTLTTAATSHTDLRSARDAGMFLSAAVREKLSGGRPDVLILFSSPEYDYAELLATLDENCKPRVMVGCSSAGEFSGCRTSNASASVMAISSKDILFNARAGAGLRTDRKQAISDLLPVFTASEHTDFPYRSALILTDALAGYTDELIHDITVETRGTYQLFGGGAADDAKFRETHVFLGTQVFSDAAVVLEILSKKPLGLGVRHGWESCSDAFRVTEVEGNRLVSLNAIAAGDVFEKHARSTGQKFDRADPLPFFLHNVIGIDTSDGYKLRVPLTLNADGSVSCASEIPAGATVRIMSASMESAAHAARQAAQSAIDGLRGEKHAGSLIFDCAATRLRLGLGFGNELKAVADTLGSENFAGCNTYGQIARAEGQFSGFHNCTAIVCAIPE